MLSLTVVLSYNSVIAQDTSSTYNESVVVTGAFTPVIENHDKINIAPEATDTSTSLQHTFAYQLQPYRLTSLFNPSRIKAVRITGEPRTRLYHSYFKLGMGNYWSPLAEAYINSTTSRDFNYGIHLNHNSAWGKIGDAENVEEYYGKAPYSLTDLTIFGKYIIKERTQLYTDLSYQNDYNLYYGFNDSTLHRVLGKTRDEIETSDYKAVYNLIAWNIGIRSLPSSRKLNYNVTAHLSDLIASYGQTELNYNLQGKISYDFNIGKQNTLTLGLFADVDGYTQNVELYSEQPLGHQIFFEETWTPDSNYMAKASRQIFTINPYIATTLAGFDIDAGAHILIDHYTDPSNTTTHAHPEFSISRNFFRESLGIELSAEGHIEAMSWNKQRLVNPYIRPNSDTRISHEDCYQFKLRYNFSKKLELDLHARYIKLENALAFRLDENYHLNNVFNAYYMTFDYLQLGGDFSFVNDEMLSLSVGGNYNHSIKEYDTLPLIYLYQFEAHLLFDLNYHDKFLFHLKSMIVSSMNANFEYNEETSQYDITETLPLRYGVDFELEYRHNHALSFFLRFENLLFQRYYYWQNYPSMRGRFLLGLTYTIPTF